MDAQLQQISKIRPQQANCIAYRTSTDIYNKMLKKTCTSELKNLMNVEIAVEQVELKIPDPRKLPPLSPLNSDSHLKGNSKTAELLQEANVVKQYLQLL